jgi:hypothetical protein
MGRQVLTEVCLQLLADGRTHVALEVETTTLSANTLYRTCGFVESTIYVYYSLYLTNGRRAQGQAY